MIFVNSSAYPVKVATKNINRVKVKKIFFLKYLLSRISPYIPLTG